jgi:hypothetical protein
MESIFGVTEGATRETGKAIKCTDMGSIFGKMDVNMKVSMLSTKKLVKENITGRMVRDLRAHG